MISTAIFSNRYGTELVNKYIYLNRCIGFCFLLLPILGYGDGFSRPQLPIHDSGVMVIAHRGCWGFAPENSLQSIKDCIELGVDMIEIDVRLTADGIPVLMHDDTIDRTTTGKGAINTMSLEQTRQYQLKLITDNADGEEYVFTEEVIPTLEEALTLTRGKLLVNLDVKADVFDKAYDVVQGVGVEEEVLIKMVALPDDTQLVTAPFLGKTHFMPIVRQCRDEKPEDTCSEDLSDVVSEYAQYEPVAYEIVFQDEAYLLDGVPVIQAQGKRLWVNTLQAHHAAGHIDAKAVVDPDAHWGHLIKLGANMIQTDAPEALIQYLEHHDLR